MSTFRGDLREFPGIRIDYFESPEENCLFLLSHCHTDHMVGIAGLSDVPGARLIVSHLTKSILLNLYPQLKDVVIISIDIKQEYLYTLSDNRQILVTALPAGHCPGSVMFYLQTEAVNVLYTGDFRWRIPNRNGRNLPSKTLVDRRSRTTSTRCTWIPRFYCLSSLTFPRKTKALKRWRSWPKSGWKTRQ